MDGVNDRREYPQKPEQAAELLRTRIVDIDAIEEGSNILLRQKSDLGGLVEGPLLSACEKLYDKNIITLATSANNTDVEYRDHEGQLKPGDGAYIIVDFDSLSGRNQEIGRILGHISFADDVNQLKIVIPLTVDSTFEDVQTASLEIADKFETQPFKAITYTLAEMRQTFMYDALQPDDLSDSYYWVPELGLFYLSREHYEKAIEKDDKTTTDTSTPVD